MKVRLKQNQLIYNQQGISQKKQQILTPMLKDDAKALNLIVKKFYIDDVLKSSDEDLQPFCSMQYKNS